MKTIRHSVFETNSSSTHNITVMCAEDYDKWVKDSNLYFDENNNCLITKEERDKLIVEDIIEYRKKWDTKRVFDKITENDISNQAWDNNGNYPRTHDEYYEESELEIDVNRHTLKSGEQIITLCKYGHD